MTSRARKTFLFSSLLFLCSGCFNIYSIVTPNNNTTLSSLQQAKLYQYEAEGNDFVAKEVGDIPYASKGSVIYCAAETAISLVCDNYQIKTSNGGEISYRLSNKDNSLSCLLSFDDAKDTITFDDYDVFVSIVTEVSAVGSIAEIAKTTSKDPYLQELNSVYQKGHETVFDLAKYHMTIEAKGKMLFLPFSIVNHVFVEPNGISIAFNGDDFYLVGTDGFIRQNTTKTLSSYGEDYYSGRYYQRGRNSTYSNYNYNDLCFLVDSFYGFSSEFNGLDGYLSKQYAVVQNELQSTRESLYDRGMDDLLNGLMGDGHTGSYGFTSTFGEGTYTVSAASYSERMKSLALKSKALTAKRGKNPSALRFAGNTAILTFDSFNSTYQDFTPSSIMNADVSSDTFALFYRAFLNIGKRSGIENVVIDLSLNGGGAVAGLLGALGFLTNNVHVKVMNPLTSSKNDLCYRVDTNLDGQVNAADVKSYHFYVLVSNYSFSCANLFAAICQEYGLAKIMGETSGGGSCIVRPTITADGYPFQMSGPAQLCSVASDGTWKNIDKGVTPDIPLSETQFYDDAALVTAIASAS